MTYGGLPRGKLIEFSGEEGASKTTLALDICKNASNIIDLEDNNHKILFIDAENTLDPIWAKKIFPEFDKYVIYLQPQQQTAEEIFQIAVDLISTGEVILCILDSIAILYTEQEEEKSMEGATYAGVSKALTKFSRLIVPICAKHNTMLIGINQLRDNLNWGGGTVTTGGRAWKHNCSVRLEMKRYEYFSEDRKALNTNAENPFGHTIKVSLKKSKAFPSNRKLSYYTLVYTKGIDILADTITVASEIGIVKRSGSWLEIQDLETGEIIPYTKVQGITNLRKLLVEEPKLLELITNQVNKEISKPDCYLDEEFI